MLHKTKQKHDNGFFNFINICGCKSGLFIIMRLTLLAVVISLSADYLLSIGVLLIICGY